MANRIIRESICVSDTIEALSFGAEATFYRLLVNVDDYGRIDARPLVLKARLYPIRSIDLDVFVGYMDELYRSGLIYQYTVDGKIYLQVKKWDKYQQIRTKRSKYPAPVDDYEHSDIICNQMISDDINLQQNVVLNPNPNPNPNPYPNPNPKPEGTRACAHEPADQPDDVTAPITEAEMAEERETQQTAEEYVKAYRLPYNSRTMDIITGDIRAHGAGTVKAALDAATETDKKGGISVRYYQACLERIRSGPPGRSRESPGMVTHGREEIERAYSAAIVNLDDE